MDKKLITIKKAAELLGVSIDTLRRWDKSGKLRSTRLTARGHRKYYLDEIEIFMADIFSLARKWVESKNPQEPEGVFYCQDALVFQARADRLLSELKNLNVSEIDYSLIVSVVLEIGNNSFDHNIGVWPDIRGIFFGYNLKKKQIVLADRGVGILSTLKKVLPEISSDKEALEIAFTKSISGRAPENRGNGLKFVREVVTELGENVNLEIFFQSGEAALEMRHKQKGLDIFKPKKPFRGCLVSITLNNK